MNLKLITITTEDKLNLPAILFEPEKVTNKVVIYLHGMMGSSFYSVDKCNEYAKELTKSGISFLALNNRGAGYIQSLKRKISDTEFERVNAGTAYEVLKESILDIDASIELLEKKGYTEFYLAGHSTGANKICVYDFYKPKNKISKYILLAGGDDTGNEFTQRGEKKFYETLKRSEKETKSGNGEKLSPKFVFNPPFSYKAIFDMLNPDGDYNSFPFYEALFNKKLSKKELFREFKQIKKPTFVVYGDLDEYCYGNVTGCVDAMKAVTKNKKNFEYTIIQNCDHGFTGKENEVAKLISSWLS